MKISAIITGASGMVGEGVLHECLMNTTVEKVLVIGRRPCGTVHPKLTEIIHGDFFDLSPISEKLTGYTACYFCLGVSSVGLSEADYFHLTYDLTVHAARLILQQNPSITFCYVSGSGTDSSEKGRQMWARVKGKTENELLHMGFKQAFVFRPGFMKPTAGLRNTLKLYTYLGWLFPVLRLFFPGMTTTLREVGQAMIAVVHEGYEKKVIEVPDIVSLAKKIEN